jgi:hypothetical protein
MNNVINNTVFGNPKKKWSLSLKTAIMEEASRQGMLTEREG